MRRVGMRVPSVRAWPRALRFYLVPAAGGAITALSTPPINVLAAVFVGLALLAVSVDDAPSLRAAFTCGLVWGTVGGLIGLRFVITTVERYTHLGLVVGLLALLVLAVVQAVAWGSGAAFTKAITRWTSVPFPLAFACGVFGACAAPGVFTWTPAGLLASRPELVQLAEYVGELGVSFVVALIAAIGVRGLRRSARDRLTPARSAVLAVGVPLMVAIAVLVGLDRWGEARMSSVAAAPSGQALRVALIDEAAPANTHLDLAQQDARILSLWAISARADDASVDLVVWPEGAYPVPLPSAAQSVPHGAPPLYPPELNPGARAPRLFGLQTYERRLTAGGRAEVKRYNSATIGEPDGSLQPAYDKVKLLWFGETVPLGAQLPFLRHIFGNGSSISPGSNLHPLLLPRPARLAPGPPLRIGVLICYEDTSSGLGRRVARAERPQLLVNVTNDAWFAGTAAPALQARFAVLRAIELRTPLVRAVNGGGSSWIDATGRIRVQEHGPAPDFTIASPELRPRDASLTIYARFGNWPAWALIGLLVLAGTLWRRHEQHVQ